MSIEYQKLVDKWLAKTASTEELDTLWAEAVQNDELIEYMEITAGTKRVLEGKQDHLSKKTKTATVINLKPWLSVAAIVLVAVAFGLMVKLNRTDQLSIIQHIDLLELEGADVTRSVGAYESVEDSLLTLGIKATINGKKKQAIELFNELISKSPHSESAGKAYLNLGIITYNDGDFAESIQSFEKIPKIQNMSPFVVEKAYWFMAHAYHHTGNIEKAREAALSVYKMNITLRKSAFILVKELDQKLKFKTFDDDFEVETEPED